MRCLASPVVRIFLELFLSNCFSWWVRSGDRKLVHTKLHNRCEVSTTHQPFFFEQSKKEKFPEWLILGTLWRKCDFSCLQGVFPVDGKELFVGARSKNRKGRAGQSCGVGGCVCPMEFFCCCCFSFMRWEIESMNRICFLTVTSRVCRQFPSKSHRFQRAGAGLVTELTCTESFQSRIKIKSQWEMVK